VLDTLARPVLVNRIVYATITVMSVLIIYDGWQQLRLIDVIAVIAGPVVAMFIAHAFSASPAKQVELGRGPFLLLCVPPALIVSILFAFGASLNGAIRVTLWIEAASLGYWGYAAARRAGVVGWRVLAHIAGGLAVGVVVLLLQVALQPGKAFSGGVALG
jgi:hypothetical protein